MTRLVFAMAVFALFLGLGSQATAQQVPLPAKPVAPSAPDVNAAQTEDEARSRRLNEISKQIEKLRREQMALESKNAAPQAPLPAKQIAPPPPAIPRHLLSEDGWKKQQAEATAASQANLDEIARLQEDEQRNNERIAEICRESGACSQNAQAQATQAASQEQAQRGMPSKVCPPAGDCGGQAILPQTPKASLVGGCDPATIRIHESLREDIWGREFVRVRVYNHNSVPIAVDSVRYGTVLQNLCPAGSITLVASRGWFDHGDTGILELTARPWMPSGTAPDVVAMNFSQICVEVMGRQDVTWIVNFEEDQYQNQRRPGFGGRYQRSRATTYRTGSYGRSGGFFGGSGQGYGRCY